MRADVSFEAEETAVGEMERKKRRSESEKNA